MKEVEIQSMILLEMIMELYMEIIHGLMDQFILVETVQLFFHLQCYNQAVVQYFQLQHGLNHITIHQFVKPFLHLEIQHTQMEHYMFFFKMEILELILLLHQDHKEQQIYSTINGILFQQHMISLH